MSAPASTRPYVALLGAVLVFTVCLLTALWAERGHERAIRDQYRTSFWVVAQAELEMQRLLRAIDRLGLGDADLRPDDLALRYEIALSRLEILHVSEEAAAVRHDPAMARRIADVRGALNRLEPRLLALQGGDRTGYAALRAEVEPLAAQAQEIARGTWLHELRVAGADRADGAHGLVIGSLAGIAAAGFALLLLLWRERRKTGQALALARESRSKEAEARHRLLDAIESFPGGFALYDAEDRLALCNGRYRDLVSDDADAIHAGMTFEQAARAMLARGLIVEAVGREEEWLAARLAGRAQPEHTIDFGLADGRGMRVRERAVGAGGRVMLVVDVTETKRREAALARLAERNTQFAAAIAALPVGVVIGDATRPGYPIVFANPAFRAMSGYAEGELMGRTSSMLRGPGTNREATAALNHLLQARQTGQVELLNYRKDGTTWWNRVRVAPVADESGQARFMIGVNSDISASRVAEQALRESEARFRSLAESLPAAVVIWDEAGRMQFWNPGAEQLFGYSPEAAIGTSIARLVPARFRDRGDDLPPSAFTEPCAAKRVVILRADGTEVEAECTLATWPSTGGRLHASFIQDISDRLRAEHERKVLEAQFQHAQRMEAIGTLAGGVAHDFNNILAIMMGHAEILQMDAERDSAAAANLAEIMTAGRRATDLVRQLLSVSRDFGRDALPIALADAAREAHGLLRATLPASIDLVLRAEAESAVLADPTQMHQVIVNLCVNAQHAIGDAPGRIEILVEDVAIGDGPPPALGLAGPAVAAMLIGTLAPGAYVRLLVTDTGCGMTEVTLFRAFEPFFTTKARGRGTGLGLAALRGIVLAHDGAVQVESLKGTGTWIAVYLPRRGEARAVQAEAASPTPAGVGRILLVDDEEAIVRVGAETLRRLGYRVDVATDPSAALDAFRARPADWDLVVSDQTMPRMSGLDLARAMLALRPELPIVLCTGYSESVTEDVARGAGISEFLMKPVRARELPAAVARALSRSSGARAA